MIGDAHLVTVLKYVLLTACCACWAYAVYHGTIFEGRLKAKHYSEIEALNHPLMLFSRNLPSRALESRRKVFAALAIFAVLGLCLIVILHFDSAGTAQSPFLFPSGSR
jgi:hypothetical protein